MSDEAQAGQRAPSVLTTEISTVTISRDLLDAARRTVGYTQAVHKDRLRSQFTDRYDGEIGGPALDANVNALLDEVFDLVRSDLERRLAVEYVFGKARKSTPSQKESHDV